MAVDIRQTNLFGGDDPAVDPPNTSSYYARWRLEHLYRAADGEENCGNCGRGYQARYHDKRYRKCALLGDSRSSASDVSRRCVCACWVYLAYGGHCANAQ